MNVLSRKVKVCLRFVKIYCSSVKLGTRGAYVSMSEPARSVFVVPVRLYSAEMELVKQLEKKLGLKLPQVVRVSIHRLAESEGLAPEGYKAL